MASSLELAVSRCGVFLMGLWNWFVEHMDEGGVLGGSSDYTCSAVLILTIILVGVVASFILWGVRMLALALIDFTVTMGISLVEWGRTPDQREDNQEEEMDSSSSTIVVDEPTTNGAPSPLEYEMTENERTIVTRSVKRRRQPARRQVNPPPPTTTTSAAAPTPTPTAPRRSRRLQNGEIVMKSYRLNAQ